MDEVTARPGKVVAIDGPAASGKSTTAAAVAGGLGFVHLNSGLLYRAFTWRTLSEGWEPGGAEYDDRVRSVHIELEPGDVGLRVLIDGEDPGEDLLGQDVAAGVSAVAGVGTVRAAVLAILRGAGEQFDLVCDGRDIGTTVFPTADLKIFLVADVRERARRRLLDLEVIPGDGEVEEEAARLARRDAADANRELSPLRRAPDAVEIDTTSLAPEQVVDAILELAAARGMSGPGSAA
ncbi:MAG: (d)CMP kinase [Gemmatimonadota bacterium]